MPGDKEPKKEKIPKLYKPEEFLALPKSSGKVLFRTTMGSSRVEDRNWDIRTVSGEKLSYTVRFVLERMQGVSVLMAHIYDSSSDQPIITSVAKDFCRSLADISGHSEVRLTSAGAVQQPTSIPKTEPLGEKARRQLESRKKAKEELTKALERFGAPRLQGTERIMSAKNISELLRQAFGTVENIFVNLVFPVQFSGEIRPEFKTHVLSRRLVPSNTPASLPLDMFPEVQGIIYSFSFLGSEYTPESKHEINKGSSILLRQASEALATDDIQFLLNQKNIQFLEIQILFPKAQAAVRSLSQKIRFEKTLEGSWKHVQA